MCGSAYPIPDGLLCFNSSHNSVRFVRLSSLVYSRERVSRRLNNLEGQSGGKMGQFLDSFLASSLCPNKFLVIKQMTVGGFLTQVSEGVPVATPHGALIQPSPPTLESILRNPQIQSSIHRPGSWGLCPQQRGLSEPLLPVCPSSQDRTVLLSA